MLSSGYWSFCRGVRTGQIPCVYCLLYVEIICERLNLHFEASCILRKLCSAHIKCAYDLCGHNRLINDTLTDYVRRAYEGDSADSFLIEVYTYELRE